MTNWEKRIEEIRTSGEMLYEHYKRGQQRIKRLEGENKELKEENRRLKEEVEVNMSHYH